MLVSKLKTTYPQADPSKWLTGESYKEIDPIFAKRLAAVAKATGVKIDLNQGYRSTSEQTALYNKYLLYLKTGKGNIKSAAKPGTSWHEFRLAVDTSTYPIRGWNNTKLASYGLCKPISSEGWHIQPIETKGLSGSANRNKWKPNEVADKEVDEELVTTTEVMVNGEKKSVKRILKDGENYIRLRDFDDVLGICQVDYDYENKIAIIKD